jgi:hypothetical protein
VSEAKRGLCAVCAALAIAIFGAVPCFAATGVPTGDERIIGTVSTVKASSFSVGTTTSTVTVNVVATTSFDPVSATAALQGFVAGDAVEVIAVKKKVVGVTVTYDVAPFPIPVNESKAGVYVDSTDSSLTIQNVTTGVQFTFVLNDDTEYLQNGKATTTPKLIPGDKFKISAQELTNSQWQANVVAYTTPKKA